MSERAKVEWRTIPEYDRYEINNLGDVRRIEDGRMMVSTLRGNHYYYKLKGDWKYRDCRLSMLMSSTFPELPHG